MDGENTGKTFTMEELTQKINEARGQAVREGKKSAIEGLGFESVDDLKAFIEESKAAKEAALSEAEKREQALQEREALLTKREAETAAAALDLVKKNALASLGASGDNLQDAARLLDITADMDADAVTEAAKQIQGRHPEMFTTVKPAPEVPAVNPPARPNMGNKPGDYGAQMAERLFGKKTDMMMS